MTLQVSYPHDPSSVAAARRFVDEALCDYGQSLREKAKLTVSEVATNAVKHARSGFVLNVSVNQYTVRVEIRDFGIGKPVRREPRADEPSGRGLLIVQAMSDSWGVDDHGNGKTVWFTLEAGSPVTSERLNHSCENQNSSRGYEEGVLGGTH